MTSERWRQVDRLYHSALEREPDSHEAVIIRFSLQTGTKAVHILPPNECVAENLNHALELQGGLHIGWDPSLSIGVASAFAR
jgi:hypothetical protein